MPPDEIQVTSDPTAETHADPPQAPQGEAAAAPVIESHAPAETPVITQSVSSDTPQAAQADLEAATDVDAQPAESAPAQPAETPSDGPASLGDENVPMARLKGVQRQLAAVEKDRDSYKTMATALQAQLATAEKRAATEYAERIRATHRDIVPQLINGETIDQVDKALANSKAAFAAAQQAYARSIPTSGDPRTNPVGNPSAPQAPAQPQKSPLQLIRDGITQPKQDINR